MQDICNMVKPYWGVSFVPTTLFSRDKLKIGLDGSTTIGHFDKFEVEKYIAT